MTLMMIAPETNIIRKEALNFTQLLELFLLNELDYTLSHLKNPFGRRSISLLLIFITVTDLDRVIATFLVLSIAILALLIILVVYIL
jgi:hypothetical protein